MIPKSSVTEPDSAVSTSIPASMTRVSAGISSTLRTSFCAAPESPFIAETSIVFSTK